MFPPLRLTPPHPTLTSQRVLDTQMRCVQVYQLQIDFLKQACTGSSTNPNCLSMLRSTVLLVVVAAMTLDRLTTGTPVPDVTPGILPLTAEVQAKLPFPQEGLPKQLPPLSRQRRTFPLPSFLFPPPPSQPRVVLPPPASQPNDLP
ncbi:uncharacterized protein LOC125179177, partial [Hyalella azteca]|uniref:Uncharacterized protein LOC125179177 n=1 Tax=Hyalella azteca TaxID=294128 RepID=A0A979FVG2_HYAAZ